MKGVTTVTMKNQRQCRRFHFTKRAIDALPANDPDSLATDAEYSDQGCTGLHLRVSKAGRKFYMMRYTFRGRKQCIAIAEHTERFGVAEARLMVAEYKAMIVKGMNPKDEREAQRTDVTFEEFCASQYIPMARARKKTWASDEKKIERVLNPMIGSKPLKAITARDAVAIHAKERDRASATTANRVLSTLKRILSVAVRLGFLDKNPAASEEKFAEPPPRERYLSREELPRFLRALDDDADGISVAAIRMLLFTGCRRSEIVSLRWDQVRRTQSNGNETWQLYLPTTKNGKPRTIQLNSKAVAELRNLMGRRDAEARTKDSDYIFPSRNGTKKGYVFDLRKPFEKALKAAGIEGVRLHDVRRTFGSWGVQGGASIYSVQRLLGHRNVDTTQSTYAHLADESLRQTSENIAAMIDEAVDVANAKATDSTVRSDGDVVLVEKAG